MLLKQIKSLWLVLILFVSVVDARAQCTSVNTAFGDGEQVTYNAFYNWGFIWLNAGW
ncbi:hypothetical protein [Geofilum rubicundum]|uniref:hypothetical protein n=1 Tax=Geofilum rubicundum TaxID=472113 RepID=UPI001D0E764D|nr:hypothetical protein [Geofilum rubicundum]